MSLRNITLYPEEFTELSRELTLHPELRDSLDKIREKQGQIELLGALCFAVGIEPDTDKYYDLQDLKILCTDIVTRLRSMRTGLVLTSSTLQ